MGRWMALALAGAAGLFSAVALTSPARGDLLPTLPISVPISLPTITTPAPVPPPPELPPLPPPALPVAPPALPVPSAPEPAGPRAAEQSSAAISRVKTSRTRTSTSSAPARRGTVIGFRLRAAGKVALVVRRNCAVVGRRQVRGHAGVNRVRFAGRVRGHRLRPGTYTITVAVARAGKWSKIGKLGVRVAPARVTKAPVRTQSCELVAATVPPPQLLAAGAPLAASGTRRAAAKQPPPLHTSSVLPPKLPLPAFADSQSVQWVLYGVMGLAALTLLVALTEFMRKQWPARG